MSAREVYLMSTAPIQILCGIAGVLFLLHTTQNARAIGLLVLFIAGQYLAGVIAGPKDRGAGALLFLIADESLLPSAFAIIACGWLSSRRLRYLTLSLGVVSTAILLSIWATFSPLMSFWTQSLLPIPVLLWCVVVVWHTGRRSEALLGRHSMPTTAFIIVAALSVTSQLEGAILRAMRVARNAVNDRAYHSGPGTFTTTLAVDYMMLRRAVVAIFFCVSLYLALKLMRLAWNGLSKQ